MSRRNIILALCVVAAVLLAVWFVIPDREERAGQALEAAQRIEQTGRFDQAITAYERILEDYPRSGAAAKAIGAIDRVRAQKDRLLVLNARKDYERIALVLNGYREMLGQMPASVEQLDNGDYMFDSEYLAEIVPPGALYCIRFEPEAAAYSVFLAMDGTEKVVEFDASGQSRIVSVSELEKMLRRDDLNRIDKGGMVFLQP